MIFEPVFYSVEAINALFVALAKPGCRLDVIDVIAQLIDLFGQFKHLPSAKGQYLKKMCVMHGWSILEDSVIRVAWTSDLAGRQPEQSSWLLTRKRAVSRNGSEVSLQKPAKTRSIVMSFTPILATRPYVPLLQKPRYKSISLSGHPNDFYSCPLQ